MFLLAILLSSVIPGSLGVESSGSFEMAEERPSIRVRLAPNWLRAYEVEPEAYMKSLRQHLEKLWPNTVVSVSLGPDMAEIGHATVSGSDSISPDDVIGEVSDHFDRYE